MATVKFGLCADEYTAFEERYDRPYQGDYLTYSQLQGLLEDMRALAEAVRGLTEVVERQGQLLNSSRAR